jgi:uncharacterized protein YfaS (alpha-2-macroglobulin family)
MRTKSIIAVLVTTTLFWLSGGSSTLAADPQPSGAPSSGAPRLIGITPSGDDVEPPHQIVFQFSAPVVPLGRMERTPQEISIASTPSLPCEWRWINTSVLTCNLTDNNLPPEATTYSLVVPKGFDLTRGTVLADEGTGTFTTKRPAVTFALFKGWSSPGRPILEVAINQRITVDALRKHLVLEDSQKRSHPFNLEHSTSSYESDDPTATPPPPQVDELRWILTPQNDLPLDTQIALKVTPGMSSLAGPELGKEDRTIVTFHTFPQFEFLGVGCFDIAGNPIEILTSRKLSGSRQRAERCDPLNAVNLLFTSPVLKDQIKDALKVTPGLRGGRTDFDPWADVYSYTQLQWGHSKDQRYTVSLPYGLKANTSYSLQGTAPAIHDEFGRALTADLSAAFVTSHRAPRYVLDNQISVLEKDVDSKLPVIVNNLKAVKLSYQAVTSTTNEARLEKTLTPYDAQDIAYAYPIDVRSMLGGRSGALQGNLRTVPSTSAGSRWFFSEVTPYEVHAKLGHFSSAVWVASFATGQPIKDANVSIEVDTMTNMSKAPHRLASAATDITGIAYLPGTRTIDPKLTYDSEWEYSKPRLFVRVEKDGDIALLPLVWDFRVYSREEYSISRSEFGHIHTWGTTAQGLYKAGDTIHFSLWVRDQNDTTFVAAPRSTYKLEVNDPTGKAVFTVPEITLSQFGSFAGSFATRRDAAVGWYTFTLKANFTGETWEPLRVLVSDFTPASFKVSSEIKEALFHQGDTVQVTTEARLHAGGPYADSATRITALVRSAPIEPSDTQLSKFYFESPSLSDSQIYQKEEKLNAQGNLSSTITIPAVPVVHGDLIVESAVRDDRGKFVATTSKARFVGRSRYVGVEQPDWLLTAGKEASIRGVVIDESGKAIAGSPLSVTVELEETKAVRVKSAGNVYVTKYENTWAKVHSCSLTSTMSPVACSFTPRQAGEYRITASVTDDKGQSHQSTLTRWASGSETVLWNTGTSTELEIVPEKKSYKVGETARFLIQNPFPGSQVLLTTERYGIQKAWTKVLSASTEVIEVPVTKDHIPGFFFSATVVSPRVAKPVEGTVDLGKPAFRMGYTKIDVIDPSKQLQVNVAPVGEVFRPQDTVTVNIAATSADRSIPPMEYAVSVLDEAVFDLIQGGKNYFDPYKGFYTLDPLDVKNFNLIKMLVGLQKFETKGASPGGDGGATLDMRSIKKYVSYWNPSVRPDNTGKATISFEAPDNLTGWKVLVMAITKDDQMGLGIGTFKVNKDTEVRPALPNQVREGDTFTATFTVMNRTERTRKLTIEGRAEGAATAQPVTMTIEAEPFKRYPINLQSKALHRGVATFSVTAGDQSDKDGVSETLAVLPRAALQSAANFGSSDGKEVKEPIEFSADLQPGVGSVGVVLSSSIIGGLEGAFTYMKEYPYLCWEQKLSKGVMAAHAIALRRYLPKNFEWRDADKLVVSTLADLTNHQAPNGGMAFYQATNEYVNQYLSAYTALALTWLRDSGYQIPEEQENKLHEYLLGVLKNEEFPTFFSPGMKSSVRAVALAALARRGKITLQDLVRYSSSVKEMNVFGKANYLLAALEVANSKQYQTRALQQILALSNQSAGTLTFTEPIEALSGRILDSNVRSQCAVLDLFVSLAQGKDRELSEKVSPLIPKLVRSITLERKRKDRWENTQENLFCMNALVRYSEVYEREDPNLDLSVRIGSEELAKVTMRGVRGEPLEVSRPLTAQDAGRSETLSVAPTGKGRFYYTSRLSYAPRDIKQSATNAGMELHREYSVERNGVWTLLKAPVAIKQGELVKVDLFLRLAAPRTFVVVDDPIPGGLEPVNRDLATASSVDSDKGVFKGAQNSIWFDFREWIDFGVSYWSFYHKEIRHAAARFYSEYLPAGNYHLSYVSQAVAPGEFIILPAHAEEMYDPDVFGDSTADTLQVTGMP